MERVIKRYVNRKLYDTTTATYVRLPELVKFVAAGYEVKVLEQATGKDLTSYTLALALSKREEEKPTELARTRIVALLRELEGKQSD